MRSHHLFVALAGILLSLLAPVHAEARPTADRTVGVLADDYGHQTPYSGSWDGEKLLDVTSYGDWVFTSGFGGATGQTIGLLGTYTEADPATMGFGARTFNAGLGGEGYVPQAGTAGPYGVLRVGIRQGSYGDPAPRAWVTLETAEASNIWENLFGPLDRANVFNDVGVLGGSGYAVGSSGAKLYAVRISLADGSAQTTRSWGSGALTSVAVVNGAVIAAGLSGDDVVLVRLDPSTLKPVWTRTIGSPDPETAVRIAADGSTFLLAAETQGPWAGASKARASKAGVSKAGADRVQARKVGSDIVLGRYDVSGKQLMLKRVGTGSDDPLADLVASPFGPIVVGPTRVDAFDPTGRPLWNRSLPVDSDQAAFTAATWSGGLILVGWTQTTLFSAPSYRDGFWTRWQTPQPDLMVQVPRKRYVGDNVWEAREQTPAVTLKRGKSVTASVRVFNEGAGGSTFTLSGCAGANKLKVSYAVGATNVTSAVKAGSHQIGPLGLKGSKVVKVKITAPKSAPRKTTTCQISAISNLVPGSFDTAGIRVKVS